MRVADLGCGVGGPLREIARVSGAAIVGVNNNEYQLERARKLTDEAGLGHLAEFLKCDFMHMDAPDESFDAAFSIESTVHAPTKVDCYGEVFRVLKPGGCFAAYEYCLTSRFDPNNPRHQKIKTDLEIGAALPDIAFPTKSTTHCGRSDSSCWKAETWLRKRGQAFPGTSPSPVQDSPLPAFAVRQRDAWRRIGTLQLMEALGIVPKGTVRVSGLLNLCATAMVASGRLGIFTPMYFVYARKPQ